METRPCWRWCALGWFPCWFAFPAARWWPEPEEERVRCKACHNLHTLHSGGCEKREAREREVGGGELWGLERREGCEKRAVREGL